MLFTIGKIRCFDALKCKVIFDNWYKKVWKFVNRWSPLKNSPLKSWLLPTSNLVAGWQTKLSYESQFFPILAKYRSCLLPKNPPMSPNFIELNSLEHQVSCSECILDLIFDWGPRVCRIKGLWVIVSPKEERFSAPVMGGKFFAAGYWISFETKIQSILWFF